jgi:purine nucleosidase/pyrimidine-specific ribonucleoside hydrolase
MLVLGALALPVHADTTIGPVVVGPNVRPITPPVPVIFDDDGSPDGAIALMLLLRNPDVSLKAITVSVGEAHPAIFAVNLTRILTRVGHSGIPVAAGDESPLQGNNVFPAEWRALSDAFWGVALPTATQKVDSLSAAELIVKTVKESAVPVTLLVTGTHTNVAEALRLDRSIACNIREIVVMGGAIYSPGNIASHAPGYTNTVSEWNIWIDPVAAGEVFSSGIPIHLLPLDATDFLKWTHEDAVTWRAAGSPEGDVAAEILDNVMQAWFVTEVSVWDLDTAAVLVNDALCPGDRLHVDVITALGAQEGRTVARADVGANMNVCLGLAAASVKAVVNAILGAP